MGFFFRIDEATFEKMYEQPTRQVNLEDLNSHHLD